MYGDPPHSPTSKLNQEPDEDHPYAPNGNDDHGEVQDDQQMDYTVYTGTFNNTMDDVDVDAVLPLADNYQNYGDPFAENYNFPPIPNNDYAVTYIPTNDEPMTDSEIAIAEAEAAASAAASAAAFAASQAAAIAETNELFAMAPYSTQPATVPGSEKASTNQYAESRSIRRIKRNPVANKADEPPAKVAALQGSNALNIRPILKRFDGQYLKKSVRYRDDHGGELVDVREIPALQHAIGYQIHTKEDMRNFETKNERFVHEAEEKVPWRRIAVKAPLRKFPISESLTKKVEETRIHGSLAPIFFNTVELMDDPKLTEEAKAVQHLMPKLIPLIKASEKRSASLIMGLPLPGRNHHIGMNSLGTSTAKAAPVAPKAMPPPVSQPAPVAIEAVKMPTPAPAVPNLAYHPTPIASRPVIEQIDSNETSNYYVAQPISPVRTAPHPIYAQVLDEQPAPEPTFQLPESLRNMMERLKNAGMVPSNEPTVPSKDANGFGAEDIDARQVSSSSIKILNNVDVHSLGTDEPFVPEEHLQLRRPANVPMRQINEPCHYFMFRPGGCKRGEQCRFLHDEALRANTIRQPNQPQAGGFQSQSGGYQEAGYQGGYQRDSGFRGARNGRFQRRDFNGPPQGRGNFRGRFHQYDNY